MVGASYFVSGSAGHSSVLELIRYACPACFIHVLESHRYFPRESRLMKGDAKYVRIPKTRIGSQSSILGWILTLPTFLRFLRELITIRPTLIHAINLDSAMIAMIYRAVVDGRCLWVYHAMDIYAYLHTTNRLVRMVLITFERAMASRANLTITVSEGFGDLLRIRDALTLYPGTFPSYEQIRKRSGGPKGQSRFPKPEGETWIMFSGIIHSKRGLPKMVSFAQGLGGTVKIICTGPVSAGYRQQFKRLLESNVILHVGFLDREEYYQLVAQCDFVAVPYDPDEYYQFAPTYKFFEALLFRKPVIATRGTMTAKQTEQLGAGVAIDFGPTDNVSDQVKELAAARTRLLKEDYYASFADAQISSFSKRYARLLRRTRSTK